MLRRMLQSVAAAGLLPSRASLPRPQTRSQMAASAASGTVVQTERRIARGIVFDMDGTLTVPVIDFVDMRRRVAAVGGVERIPGDILDFIAGLTPEQQARAHVEIADIEAAALQRMQLMPGVLELSGFLDGLRVPRALVTRNVNASVEFFHRHHFTLPPFTPALSREFAPYKPNPASLLHIAERWGVAPAELVMIGDSAKDDIVCGNRAGALTILLDQEGRWGAPEELPGEERPHWIARSLADVQAVLSERVELLPPPRPPQPLDD